MKHPVIKKYFFLLILIFFFCCSAPAQIQVSGVNMPQKLTYIENEPLALFGTGARTFLWMDMYVGAIFLNESNLKANAIIEANESMALRLHILSSFVSNKRIIKAIQNGFNEATDGNLKAYEQRIDKMISFFNDDIKPNDIIDLVYKTSGHTSVYRNARLLGNIDGLDFKQALFAVWLSDKAVDQGFKKDLLKGI